MHKQFSCGSCSYQTMDQSNFKRHCKRFSLHQFVRYILFTHINSDSNKEGEPVNTNTGDTSTKDSREIQEDLITV
jgi:hypothetical protein